MLNYLKGVYKELLADAGECEMCSELPHLPPGMNPVLWPCILLW